MRWSCLAQTLWHGISVTVPCQYLQSLPEGQCVLHRPARSPGGGLFETSVVHFLDQMLCIFTCNQIHSPRRQLNFFFSLTSMRALSKVPGSGCISWCWAPVLGSGDQGSAGSVGADCPRGAARQASTSTLQPGWQWNAPQRSVWNQKAPAPLALSSKATLCSIRTVQNLCLFCAYCENSPCLVEDIDQKAEAERRAGEGAQLLGAGKSRLRVLCLHSLPVCQHISGTILNTLPCAAVS